MNPFPFLSGPAGKRARYLLCLVVGTTATAVSVHAAREPFDRYLVIVGKKPFGKVEALPDPSPAGAGEPFFAKELRLSGIINLGGRPKAYIEDARSKSSLALGLGDVEDGMELVSVDEQKESVILRKGTQMAVLELQGSAQPLTGTPAEAPAAAGSAPPAKPRRALQPAAPPPPPPSPFRNEEEMLQYMRAYQKQVVAQGLPPLPLDLDEQGIPVAVWEYWAEQAQATQTE